MRIQALIIAVLTIFNLIDNNEIPDQDINTHMDSDVVPLRRTKPAKR